MRQVSADRFKAKICRESYWQFFQEFWSETAAEVFKPAWYIKLQCDELQRISERIFASLPREYDIVWNCPPASTKSTNVSVLWNAWIWTRMPSARFLSGSYTERLALDLSRKTRDVVISEKYRRLFPDIALREDQNTKGYFANTKGGFRFATGVGGSATGMHSHFLAIDDPIDPQEALSTALLEEADYWMREVLSRRKVDLTLTVTVLVQQRLHQDDPSARMLDRGVPVKHFCIPADTQWEIKPPELREYYSSEGLMDPVRFPQGALDEALATLLDVGYAGQYGQQPVPRGGAKFDVRKFIIENSPPSEIAPGKGPLRYWDKAATLKGGAFTVGTKGAFDKQGDFWILDVERFQLNSGRREAKILEVAKKDTKKCKIRMEQEPAGSGKEAAEQSQASLALAGFPSTLDRVTGDKELRADAFSVYVNMGKVHILRAPWNKAFLQELQFFPLSKYKDQVDSASGCFNSLAKKRVRVGAFS